MITASLNNYRQSPRKVRLIASLVKGKSVDKAVSLLQFTVKEASAPICKLIQSASANAKHNFQIDQKDLFVKTIEVNPGVVMKRSSPNARGRAFIIRKRTSHVTLVLDTTANAKSLAKSADKKTKK